MASYVHSWMIGATGSTLRSTIRRSHVSDVGSSSLLSPCMSVRLLCSIAATRWGISARFCAPGRESSSWGVGAWKRMEGNSFSELKSVVRRATMASSSALYSAPPLPSPKSRRRACGWPVVKAFMSMASNSRFASFSDRSPAIRPAQSLMRASSFRSRAELKNTCAPR